jgi:hypothetical protein
MSDMETMTLLDYSKVARFGDLIEYNTPGHVQFVLASCAGHWVQMVWVGEIDGFDFDNFHAKDHAHYCQIMKPDWGIKIIRKANIKNNTMKITNLVKKLLDNDTRTLVRAGFVNGDLALTEEGTAELLSILFLEKKDELVKVANEKLADETK